MIAFWIIFSTDSATLIYKEFFFRVFITIGAAGAPPTALKNARYCSPQQPKAASKAVYDKFSVGEFTVDWCHLSAVSALLL